MQTRVPGLGDVPWRIAGQADEILAVVGNRADHRSNVTSVARVDGQHLAADLLPHADIVLRPDRVVPGIVRRHFVGLRPLRLVEEGLALLREDEAALHPRRINVGPLAIGRAGRTAGHEIRALLEAPAEVRRRQVLRDSQIRRFDVRVEREAADRLNRAGVGREGRLVDEAGDRLHRVAEDELVIVGDGGAHQVELQKSFAGLVDASVEPQAGNARENGRAEGDVPVVQSSVQGRNLDRVGVDRLGDDVVFAMQGSRLGLNLSVRGTAGGQKGRRSHAAGRQHVASRELVHGSPFPWRGTKVPGFRRFCRQ